MPATPSATPPAQAWEARLREAGLRSTVGRVTALGYLAEHPHSTATDIFAALQPQLPSLTLQSVHNVVQDLTACGILRRLDPLGPGGARYETRTDDNHHHLQCIRCGRIEDVDCAIGAAPCLAPHHTFGMRVLQADVTYRGICEACDTAELAAAASHAQ